MNIVINIIMLLEPQLEYEIFRELGTNKYIRATKFWIYFYFIESEAWGKYCNRSRGKLDFNRSSGKDYGTNSLNLSHKL